MEVNYELFVEFQENNGDFENNLKEVSLKFFRIFTIILRKINTKFQKILHLILKHFWEIVFSALYNFLPQMTITTKFLYTYMI